MSQGSLASFSSFASFHPARAIPTIRHCLMKGFAVAVFAAGGLVAVTGSVGCNHTNGSALVPQGAHLVGVGAGRDNIAYQVHEDGTAYVTDAHHDRVVWKGAVHAGDKVTVDGDHNQILLNGDVVSQNDISKRHDYQLYVHP